MSDEEIDAMCEAEERRRAEQRERLSTGARIAQGNASIITAICGLFPTPAA